MTRNGKTEKVEILNEDIRGEGAIVNFKFHFKDDKTEEDVVELIIGRPLEI